TKEVEELKTSLESIKNGNLYLWQILQCLNSSQQASSSLPATEYKTQYKNIGSASFPDNVHTNTCSAHVNSLHDRVTNHHNIYLEEPTAQSNRQQRMEANGKINRISPNKMVFSSEKCKEDGNSKNLNINEVGDEVRIYNPIKSSLPLPPGEFQVLRQVDSTSLLLWWNPPSSPAISGYEVSIYKHYY
ncbi:hypothetical protein L9F63_011761, partial [Diploptera punctata]